MVFCAKNFGAENVQLARIPPQLLCRKEEGVSFLVPNFRSWHLLTFFSYFLLIGIFISSLFLSILCTSSQFYFFFSILLVVSFPTFSFHSSACPLVFLLSILLVFSFPHFSFSFWTPTHFPLFSPSYVSFPFLATPSRLSPSKNIDFAHIDFTLFSFLPSFCNHVYFLFYIPSFFSPLSLFVNFHTI